jgi:hypothetical protein
LQREPQPGWLETRATPSMGFFVLSTESAQAIVDVSVSLADTVRSQGFSPSQRFAPAWASRLCFAPHPPIGFVLAFRAFPVQSAVLPFDSRYSHAVGLASTSVGKPLVAVAPGAEAPRPLVEPFGATLCDPHHRDRLCDHIGRFVQPRSCSPSCCDRVAGVGVTARGKVKQPWIRRKAEQESRTRA